MKKRKKSTELESFENMDQDEKISEFLNAKIKLSVAIKNLTQFSEIFLETVEIPQEKMLGPKLSKLKIAIETVDLLLNSLNDIFGESNITEVNIKTEPTEENVDAWPINTAEVNIQSKPTEEEDYRPITAEKIDIKSEPPEEKVDGWPSNITEVNIYSEPIEEKIVARPINIAEVNIKSETTEEETAIEANPIDIDEIPQMELHTSNEIKRKVKISKREAVIKKYECLRLEKCARLEKEGGLKEETLKRRDRTYKEFAEFTKEETGHEVEDLVVNEDGWANLSKAFSRYFFKMRVMTKSEPEEKLPKRQTAEAIKSHIKQVLIEKFQLDITDPCLFPDVEKKWKAFISELVAKGRNETEHHPEVDPETLLKIYQFLGHVLHTLKARGTRDYDDKLAKIPPKLHGCLNKVIQCGAMLVLMMFEVRKAGEKMEFLEAKDFKVFDDHLFEFRYIRRCISEAEKNAQQGSNSQCQGIIPYLNLADGFNPGELFEWYLSVLPKEANKDDKKYLFPKPRTLSKKFDPHNPEERLFEINMKVGKNEVYKLLPFLCEATNSPRQTNYSVRATSIMYLRQMGFSWETIIKITGHRSTATLVKNYDLKLETKGLAAMAGAIGNGPIEAIEEDRPLMELQKMRKVEDQGFIYEDRGLAYGGGVAQNQFICKEEIKS